MHLITAGAHFAKHLSLRFSYVSYRLYGTSKNLRLKIFSEAGTRLIPQNWVSVTFFSKKHILSCQCQSGIWLVINPRLLKLHPRIHFYTVIMTWYEMKYHMVLFQGQSCSLDKPQIFETPSVHAPYHSRSPPINIGHCELL